MIDASSRYLRSLLSKLARTAVRRSRAARHVATPQRRSARPAVERLGDRIVPAQYLWSAPAGTTADWAAVAAWREVNGAVTAPATAAPGAGDSVEFSGGGNCTVSAFTMVQGFVVSPGFSGKITLNQALRVNGTFSMAGSGAAAIDQPLGAASTLHLNGPSFWSGGALNSTNTLSEIVVADTAKLQINATYPVKVFDPFLGDQWVYPKYTTGETRLPCLLGSTLTIERLASVTVQGDVVPVKNAASVVNKGALNLHSRGLQTPEGQPPGSITNTGTVLVNNTAGPSTRSDLPLLNTASTSQLLVKSDFNVFGLDATNGVSLYQGAGLTKIEDGKSLYVKNGYTQRGGRLETDEGTATIDGDVEIHQGAGPASEIALGVDGFGVAILQVSGKFTMDGGTWYAQVRGDANEADQLVLKGDVTIGGTSRLDVEPDVPIVGRRNWVMVDSVKVISGKFGNPTLPATYEQVVSADGKKIHVRIPAKVKGKVDADLDGDGIEDPGETGIANVWVELVDAASGQHTSAYTDAAGTYSFDDVPAGSYQVLFHLSGNNGFSPKDQGGDDTVDSDADPATGLTSVITVGDGDQFEHVDAGFAPRATVTGRVWSDADHDGLQDAGEGGVGGVVVDLINQQTGQVLSVQTDSGGNFQFTAVVPASYELLFHPPSGASITLQNQGTNDAVDSDVNSAGYTDVFQLLGGSLYDLDAGLFLTPIGVVVGND